MRGDSFKKFCEDINRQDILDLWDYELNNKDPDEVTKQSNCRIYFKCPRGLHESREISLNSVTKAYDQGKEYCICKKCNSFGQYVVDTYGEDYLNKIWSDKNELSPFDISRRSPSTIWLKCQQGLDHPDYDLCCSNFVISHNCSYCAGKKVCYTNSLGYNLPLSVSVWSDKNDKTAFDYTKGNKEEVWWKCENGLHDDYKRMISRSVTYNFRCPECGRKNQKVPRGEEHPNWKGGITTQAQKDRKSNKYNAWREQVYERDDYTCQCCGGWGGRLTAHHLLDYANHEDLRFVVENGITLCFDCHDSTVSGSFHNLYGTHSKTPEELKEYINNKRNELGIPIPFNIDDYKDGNRLNKDSIKEIEEFFKVWKFVPYLAGGIRPVKQDNNQSLELRRINIYGTF